MLLKAGFDDSVDSLEDPVIYPLSSQMGGNRDGEVRGRVRRVHRGWRSRRHVLSFDQPKLSVNCVGDVDVNIDDWQECPLPSN